MVGELRARGQTQSIGQDSGGSWIPDPTRKKGSSRLDCTRGRPRRTRLVSRLRTLLLFGAPPLSLGRTFEARYLGTKICGAELDAICSGVEVSAT